MATTSQPTDSTYYNIYLYVYSVLWSSMPCVLKIPDYVIQHSISVRQATAAAAAVTVASAAGRNELQRRMSHWLHILYLYIFFHSNKTKWPLYSCHMQNICHWINSRALIWPLPLCIALPFNTHTHMFGMVKCIRLRKKRRCNLNTFWRWERERETHTTVLVPFELMFTWCWNS